MFANVQKRRQFEIPPIDQNLVDIGGELSVSNLLRAYRRGAFPWTVHPVTWWSPDPRAVLEFDNFHISKSFRRTLNRTPFQVTLNMAFQEVLEACAASKPGRRSTWITPEFIQGYTEMHKAGHAHSLECWQHGKLVGGIYGVSIGGYFAGESMFHRVDDASKAALYYLTNHLRARGYRLFDVQMPTRITLQLGATLISRQEFLRRLDEAIHLPVVFGVELAG